MSGCEAYCTCMDCLRLKYPTMTILNSDGEHVVLGKRTLEQDKTTSSQPMKKRSREEVVKEAHRKVISFNSPTEYTNYVIHCRANEDVHICFEFIQPYAKYFNPTLRKMNPNEISLPYHAAVVLDVLSIAAFGLVYPYKNNMELVLEHHHERFQCMDYIDCDYGEIALMKYASVIDKADKAKAYVLVPEYREVLRGYLRENIAFLRNKSEYWPQLKEHIDDILLD